MSRWPKKFVALSKFVVANDLTTSAKAAFRHRPHMVDEAPGYLRMEVLSSSERPEEIWLVTFWIDEASFRAWHHSHLYRDSHSGIPKGLKLVPGETEVRTFEHAASYWRPRPRHRPHTAIGVGFQSTCRPAFR